MARRKKSEGTENADTVLEGSELHSGGSGSEMVDGLAASQPEPGRGNDSTVPMSSAKETITVRLTDTGRIDLEGMREKTTAKLKAALEATPEIAPGYGEVHLDGAMVPDFMVNAVYQLIGGIEQWAFARKYGSDIAAIMAYRPQDIAVLSEPTKAVLAKYLPKLGKYQEESALIMALASIHISKVQAMNAMLAQQEERRATVTEIRPAPQNPN
jgi:hypothetical protein